MAAASNVHGALRASAAPTRRGVARRGRDRHYLVCRAAAAASPEKGKGKNAKKGPAPPSAAFTEGEPAEAPGAAAEAVDIYRDTPLRFLGYANECGEAFAAWLPAGGVPASYAVAIAYVLADTLDKTRKAWARTEREECTIEEALEKECQGEVPAALRLVHTGSSMVDTLLWQLLASVFWPGSFIHLTVAATRAGIEAASASAPQVHDALAASASAGVDVEKVLPTLAGLAAIPFIVHPIDSTVHYVLNVSTRPSMLWGICGPMGGDEAGIEECEVMAEESADEAPGAQVLGSRPEKVEAAGVTIGLAAVAAAVALPPAVFGLSMAVFHY